jgi:hypothetical protein
MTARGLARLHVLLAGAGPGSSGSAANAPTNAYVVTNPIPPRTQWKANWGYCGEVSFISAGLYYG